MLLAPDVNKLLKLLIDASDYGVGDVLVRGDGEGSDHPPPPSFYSKKLYKHQKMFSTVEKESLALILAL